MTVERARVLWDMVEGPMPRGVLGLGSGDLARTPEIRTLYLGGFSTSFRNRLYTATAPPDADPYTAEWTVTADAAGRARPLVADPPRRAWDGGGMHTPSYLPAADGAPARLYYAGRRGRRHVGARSRYAIGVLEERAGRWTRREEPVLTGGGRRPSVLEPRVVRADGVYVLFHLATPHEVARGEQPDYELRVATSADGLTDWTEPVVFATSTEGFFDLALAETSAGWTMLLARGTNLHGTRPFPPQGLWAMWAPTASARRADWSPPVRLLDTDAAGTPAWMSAGVADPTIARISNNTVTVVVTGTRANHGWPKLALAHLRQRRRPPVPAPFHLSTGVLRLDLPPRRGDFSAGHIA